MGDFALTESVSTDLKSDMVDMEEGLIRGVRVFNGISRNKSRKRGSKGTSYKKVINRIAGLYEGQQVADGHTKDHRKSRDWKEIIGVFENVVPDANGASADFRVDPGWEHRDRLLKRAADPKFSNTVAFSIEIPPGKWKGRSKDGLLEVLEVESVGPAALVGKGGTTFGLFEELDEEPTVENLEQFKAEFADIAKQHADEVTAAVTAEVTASLTTQLEENFKTEKNDLLVKISQAKTEHADTQAKLIEAEAKLADIEALAKRKERKEAIVAKAQEAEVAIAEELVEEWVESDAPDSLIEKTIESIKGNKAPQRTPAPSGGKYEPKQNLDEVLKGLN